MECYHFLPALMLRAPFYSYGDYACDESARVLQDQFFQYALFLSNPVLYQLLAAKEFDWVRLTQKEQMSIARYVNRMCFRPTPFGCFSSFSIVQWGEAGGIALSLAQDPKLHLDIDQEIVMKLAPALLVDQAGPQIYHCNPAFYRVGLEFRFVKTNYDEHKKRVSFAIEGYECNQITHSLIRFCRQMPRERQAIVEHIVAITQCSRKTAYAYLDFLISAQILLPETLANLIGEDYLKRLLDRPLLHTNKFSRELEAIYSEIQHAVFPATSQLIEITSQVNSLLRDLKETPSSQIFYSGLERKVAEGCLSARYQSQIQDGLCALRYLVQPLPSTRLQQFIKDFKSRYDLQKVPLLRALDPESGIGYGELTDAPVSSDLLKKVNFNDSAEKSNQVLEWTAVHRLLLKKWNQNSCDVDPIFLNDDDLEALRSTSPLPPGPPSLAVMFRTVDDHVFLESAGGASAIAIIGRFTNWSPEIHTISRQIALAEQSANPDIIFAEIGQLSDTHADNINRRNHAYLYEIPVNSVSTLPPSQQIDLADLLISVVGEELILESINLKKVIVPRLSSAYNYNHNNLSVFRLLCDLQHQGLQSSYALDLEYYFPGMDHYPRVVLNQTTLCAAKWYLTSKELSGIYLAAEAEKFVLFTAIRTKKRLPALVAFTQFDQQLVFNIDRKEEVLFLLDCLKTVDQIMIQEYFLPSNPSVKTHDNKPLVNQFIAFLYKDERVYSGYRSPDKVTAKAKPEYIIGSRWIYLKLYCHPAVANELLVEQLLPLLKRPDQVGLKSWFFIRYHDSGYHIRLRININEASIGILLNELKNRLAASVKYQLIREYLADTYRRELERYGADIIGLVENFFHASSELVLRYIQFSASPSACYSYHSLAFVSVNHLLDSFLPLSGEQLAFLEQMIHTFYSEFSDDKSLKVDLDLKYRELKNEVVDLLGNQEYYGKQKLSNWSDLFTVRISAILKVSAEFPPERRRLLLADLIHMHLNRLFIDRQRNQELIVYYCLYKYKRAVQAIEGRRST